MEKLLNELVERLKKAHGANLAAAILYGSAAGGEHHARYSDLNVLCVLNQLGTREMAASEAVVGWWRKQGNPAPLLMSREEAARSTDCFPIEFHDMLERRRVLYGDDVIAGLTVDDKFYRAQVEHELRAKLLRLRQKAAGVLSDSGMLTHLLADSVGTFAMLARHALRLAGAPAPWPRSEALRAAEAHFGFTATAFYTLLEVRAGAKLPGGTDAMALLEQYLGEIGALTAAVDAMDV